MRTVTPVFLCLALFACNKEEDPKDTPKDTGIPDVEDTLTFAFNLEAQATLAGEEVAYTAEVKTGSGDVFVVEPDISSDKETGLRYTATDITATVAGAHVLTASVPWEGQTLTATASLQVDPGAPSALDLVVSDAAMSAGDLLTWTVSLADAWGNPMSTDLVSVAADSPDMVVGDGTLECIIPGTYMVMATVDGEDGAVMDSEWVQVYAGIPAGMDLVLSDETPELNQTVSATVSLWDSYGNEVDGDWSLSVVAGAMSDAANVAISYNNLTFLQEGFYTVVASAEDGTGGTLSDAVGPLTVDSSGPQIEIYNPTRGGWSTALYTAVTGYVADPWSGVASLQVQGTDTTPAADGSFTAPVAWDPGTNFLTTTATDGDGNSSQDLRAVLAGSYLSYGYGLGNGILARLNQAGFDTLEGLAVGMISTTDISAVIPSPAYYGYDEECIDYWFDEYCFTAYEVALYVYNPSFSGTDFQIDPVPGSLYTTFAVYNPYVEYSASGNLAGIGYSASGTVSASSINAGMYVTPYVSGGDIGVTVSSVSVSTSGFSVRLDSWLQDVLDFFGLDLGDLVEGYMTDAIVSVIEDEVPSLLQDALADLELGTTLDVLGSTYSISAVPYTVSVDDNGLTLSLQTWFTTGAWRKATTGYGSFYQGYGLPTYGASPGMELSIGLDFLNQALYAFWGGGVLDMTMAGSELGLDPADLSLLFPGITDVNVVTEALLPPTVLPGTSEALVDLQLGDYLVSLYGGPVDPEYLLLQAYVQVQGGLDVAVDDATISPSLTDVDVQFDVVWPEANTLAAADTEALMEALVPMLLPSLTSALSTIPIPEIEGFSLEGIAVDMVGPGTGYLDLGGNLVVE